MIDCRISGINCRSIWEIYFKLIPYDNASISITGVSSDWSVGSVVLLSINDLLIIELINYNRPTGVDDREIYVLLIILQISIMHFIGLKWVFRSQSRKRLSMIDWGKGANIPRPILVYYLSCLKFVPTFRGP